MELPLRAKREKGLNPLVSSEAYELFYSCRVADCSNKIAKKIIFCSAHDCWSCEELDCQFSPYQKEFCSWHSCEKCGQLALAYDNESGRITMDDYCGSCKDIFLQDYWQENSQLREKIETNWKKGLSKKNETDTT